MRIHISLDFWGTLGRFNPEYSKARGIILASHFHMPAEQAQATYKRIKHDSDARIEQTGESHTCLEMFERLGAALRSDYTTDDARKLMAEMQAAAVLNPPEINRDTVAVMRRLGNAGVSFNLLSNTNFISGEVLRLILTINNVPLDFALFSDEHFVSKPSKLFFDLVRIERPDYTIYHFGDNQVCDVDGANNAGMVGRLTSYSTLPTDLLGIFESA